MRSKLYGPEGLWFFLTIGLPTGGWAGPLLFVYVNVSEARGTSSEGAGSLTFSDPTNILSRLA